MRRQNGDLNEVSIKSKEQGFLRKGMPWPKIIHLSVLEKPIRWPAKDGLVWMHGEECGVAGKVPEWAGLGQRTSRLCQRSHWVGKNNSSTKVVSSCKFPFATNLFLFLSLVQFLLAISILTSSFHIFVGQLRQECNYFNKMCRYLIGKKPCMLYFDFVATNHEQIAFKSRIRGPEFWWPWSSSKLSV